jgi:hypothetical protein
VFDGLDEGVYAIDVAASDHSFECLAPVEVRAAAPLPELRVELARGCRVSGVVVGTQDGAPIAGAVVDLFLVDEVATERALAAAPSRFEWAFAAPGPRGALVVSTRTDSAGRFELQAAPAGRCFLSAAHEGACGRAGKIFELREDRDDFRIELPPAASLSGMLRGIPAGRAADVRIFALGGFGTLRTSHPTAESRYRFDSLQPGDYVVRAFLGEQGELDERMAALLSRGAASPSFDVRLAEGERAELDLDVEVPPLGTVAGTVTVDGEPARGFRVVLRSEDAGAATGRPWALVGSSGAYSIRDVPAGRWSLQVVSPTSRQELHRESIVVSADATTSVHPILRIGGLRGWVVAAGLRPGQIDGSLHILPGATKRPADLREWARGHRVHEVRVRDGAFRDEELTPGPALVIVEVRGRQPAEIALEIPAGTSREVELAAGPAR